MSPLPVQSRMLLFVRYTFTEILYKYIFFPRKLVRVQDKSLWSSSAKNCKDLGFAKGSNTWDMSRRKLLSSTFKQITDSGELLRHKSPMAD